MVSIGGFCSPTRLFDLPLRSTYQPSIDQLQVGPARVNGWRLRPEAGAGEGAPLEGVLYLLTEEQLMTLEDWCVGSCTAHTPTPIAEPPRLRHPTHVFTRTPTASCIGTAPTAGSARWLA